MGNGNQSDILEAVNGAYEQVKFAESVLSEAVDQEVSQERMDKILGWTGEIVENYQLISKALQGVQLDTASNVESLSQKWYREAVSEEEIEDEKSDFYYWPRRLIVEDSGQKISAVPEILPDYLAEHRKAREKSFDAEDFEMRTAMDLVWSGLRETIFEVSNFYDMSSLDDAASCYTSKEEDGVIEESYSNLNLERFRPSGDFSLKEFDN